MSRLEKFLKSFFWGNFIITNLPKSINTAKIFEKNLKRQVKLDVLV